MKTEFFNLTFVPLLGGFWLLILAFAALFFLLLIFQFNKSGFWRTILFVVAFFVATLNPSLVTTKATTLNDVAAILIDNSASMKASGRDIGAQLAANNLQEKLKLIPNLEVRTINIGDENGGTRIKSALDQAFWNIDTAQIAGAIYIGDGLVKDEQEIAKPYPIHQILIGERGENDAYLKLISGPTATKVGEIATFKLKILSSSQDSKAAKIKVYVGNETPFLVDAKINTEVEVKLQIKSRAKTPIAFEAMLEAVEITKSNNFVITSIDPIVDRLSVLLVTGEPYEGARAWRNLLKSDPNVDLIHFTILRTPQNEDLVSEGEMALIPFPTEELFQEKLDSFDLIIFDHFKRIDVLPDYYLASVADWVLNGGAFLMLTGPDEIGQNGLLATPLAPILPISGQITIIDTPFKPAISQLGLMHPITRQFANIQDSWGHWTGAFKSDANGDVLMHANGAPLLITASANIGRVGVINSDKSWQWQRGLGGGGPFRTLMARIIHWLMKAPELSSEKLILRANDNDLELTYNGLHSTQDLKLTGPDGNHLLGFSEHANGVTKVQLNNQKFGLYHAAVNDLAAFAIIGKNNETIAQRLSASADAIAKIARANGGGKSAFIGRDGKADLPKFALSKTAIFGATNQWHLRRNNASIAQSFETSPVLPPQFYAIVLALLALFMWHGRRANIS